ncbi:hypothetical protein AVEN_167475-1 [Araneus ventricosus]|uniref:Reverse transcriptase domain-containing protein n=1 Tax=Araneus ventricosus TaxID=182803 RepID=A0A4Y2ICT3_ARAVE|nr:hypothetical protein AVEN_167475-1 [Araneus ventricosus]
MPIGLRNAEQTFQRFIDETLRAIPYFVYLDDGILVVSSDDLSYLSDLEKVFARINERGLVLNTNKCIFGVHASDVGIGVVLQQQVGSDIKPLAIFSYGLPPTGTRVDGRPTTTTVIETSTASAAPAPCFSSCMHATACSCTKTHSKDKNIYYANNQ